MNRAVRAVVLLGLLVAAFAVGRLSMGGWENPFMDAAEPAAAVGEALASGGTLSRMARLAPRLQELARGEVDAVAAVYKREISTLGECDIAPFIDAWVHLDEEAALEGIATWPYPLKREIGLRSALLALATEDPPRAVFLFESLTEGHPRLRTDLQDSLVSGWAASDPAGLRGYLLGLLAEDEDVGPPLGASLGMIAQFHGVEALLAWSEDLIQEIPAGPLRAKIFRKTARTATRRDPLRAAAWVGDHWGGDYAVDGPSAVAEAWILLAPLDAIGWLQTAAPAESRSKAIELAFGRWLYEDAAAARGWIDSAERTTFHDPAVAEYARNLVRRDPDAAIGWCEQVIEPGTREKCLISVARAWFQRDGAAAAAWLEESPLDAGSRELVREWAAKKERKRAPVRKKSPASPRVR